MLFLQNRYSETKNNRIMRFKLTLQVDKVALGNMLPINYQYEQSAVIYRILSRANEEFSSWLHDNGYRLENGKIFKLFTYSRLKIEKRKVFSEAERIAILSDSVEWQISFLPEVSTEKFIQGLFSNQEFEIGDKKSAVRFKVRNVEVLPMPEFTEEMEFVTMSPMCLQLKLAEGGGTKYISPSDPMAAEIIKHGLSDRYEAFYGKEINDFDNFGFEVLNEPKSVLVKIKANTSEQVRIKGYQCQFRMCGPKALMRIMYDSGIGSLGSQGFGCVQVLPKNEKKQ